VERFIKNKKVLGLVISLQEAFTAALPYVLLTYTALLIYSLVNYLKLDWILFNPKEIKSLVDILSSFQSIVLTICIAFFVAIRFKTSQIIAVILSLAVFLTITLIETSPNFTLPKGFTPAALLNPIISTYLLKLFYPFFSLKIYRQDGNFHIYRLINYTVLFVVVYFICVVSYISVDYIMDNLIDTFNETKIPLPIIITLMIRDFFVQIFWFFGIHGTHVMNSLFGYEIFLNEMMPNLKYIEFHRLFVNIGGDGLGLPLALGLLIALKDKSLKTIIKIGFPFTLINVDTLIIYAVVVLNRFFFIPFVFLPLFNLLIAYIALHILPITFTSYNLVWTTPPIADVYLKTNGNIYALLLQIGLIVIDTYIYVIYARRFAATNTLTSNKEILEENLEIKEEIKSKESILAFKTQKELIEAQAKLNNVINTINKENLKIYYQPKVDIKNNRCNKFEALIRYNHNGKLTGPIFLDIIEEAGLAPVIDIWVCKEAKKDIITWNQKGFHPQIGVNLHPDTLKSEDAISKIIDIFKGFNITFEIIERSLLYGKIAEKNIKRLKVAGFELSIDDFGSGYSSLEIITKLNIEELKIDKSLIDIITTPKGYSVCLHTVGICHEIDSLVVAEGVETKDQLKTVMEIGVDLVQGYIFSPALPKEKAETFAKEFNLYKFIEKI